MSPKTSSPSPAERLLARRRRIFLRDWILVLIALGLAIAAGVFHRDRAPPQDPRAAISLQEARDSGAQ